MNNLFDNYYSCVFVYLVFYINNLLSGKTIIYEVIFKVIVMQVYLTYYNHVIALMFVL